MKIVSDRHYISRMIGTLLLVGLASLPSAGVGNGKESASKTAAPNNVIIKVVPVYVSPPKITVPPSAVTVASSDPSLWDQVWTVLLTFATIGQAVVAWFLLKAAHRQADAANKQVVAAEAQAGAAKEQILVSREQIEASREQIEEARLLRLTSERPMLSLQMFDDAEKIGSHQNLVNEENGDVLLATHTTIIANNHGIVPSYDTDVTIRIQGYINGPDQLWSNTLHFNVVPADRSVIQTIPIFPRSDYDPTRLGYDTAATLEVELSATYRNSHRTFFKVLGHWKVQPFTTTTSMTLSDGRAIIVRSSTWQRVENESITEVPQAELTTIAVSGN